MLLFPNYCVIIIHVDSEGVTINMQYVVLRFMQFIFHAIMPLIMFARTWAFRYRHLYNLACGTLPELILRPISLFHLMLSYGYLLQLEV